MRNKLEINSSKLIKDIDFGEPFLNPIKTSFKMFIYSCVLVLTLWLTFKIIISIYPHHYQSKTINFFILLLTVGTYVSLLFFLIIIWLKEFSQRKELRKALGNSLDKAKWKEKYLGESEIILFYLLYAKANNLLSSDEFKRKKDLFVNTNPVIYGQEFIQIVELKNDLMLTDEQFAIVKSNFINNPYSKATKIELDALQKEGILTEDEIRIKLNVMIQNTPSNRLGILKVISFGIICGGFIYSLSWMVTI